MHSHGILYDLLHRAFDIVHALGLPLAILAWVTIVSAVAGMALLLRRASRPGVWRPSIIVGLLALAGHAADIGATLIVSPDLSLEANPMWRAVADSCGLAIANLHALTGQLMVIVLSAQLFAWYLLTRDRLAPAGPCTLPQFVLQLGAHTPRRFGVRLLPLASLFAFLFATLGPYFFYVAFLNAIVHTDLRGSVPSPPVAVAIYLAATTVLYFALGYRSFRGGPATAERSVAVFR